MNRTGTKFDWQFDRKAARRKLVQNKIFCRSKT
jgi:hypothetical protein